MVKILSKISKTGVYIFIKIQNNIKFKDHIVCYVIKREKQAEKYITQTLNKKKNEEKGAVYIHQNSKRK